MTELETLETSLAQLKQRSANDKPVVAVCGLMNAGKSFLLNMLTQHFNSEYFKTSDQRETAEIAKLETEDFVYVDTPGLDADNMDDLLAKQGVSEADIVLVVHQPRGEFELIEMEFLQQLRQEFGIQADSNIIVVVSKMDKDSPEKIGQIVRRLREQCAELQNWSPAIFPVSNKQYQAGKTHFAQELIADSGMEALIVELAQRKSVVEQMRGLRLHGDSLRLSLEIDKLIAKLANERRTAQYSIAKRFNSFNKQMGQLHEFVTESILAHKKI